MKNGSIARPEARGRQEPTDEGDLARTTVPQSNGARSRLPSVRRRERIEMRDLGESRRITNLLPHLTAGRTSLEASLKRSYLIIGAGMSGLAAAIRLSMAGHSVCVVDRHKSIGGLNSFYVKDGRAFDVGLHAITNFVPKGTPKAPLTKLFRQLRIPYDAWDLCPQNGSSIQFPGRTLTFCNDWEAFKTSVLEKFPEDRDGFLALLAEMERTDAFAFDGTYRSTRAILNNYIGQALQNQLLLPLCFYGSAREDDIDWQQFIVLFQSLYREGFARPLGGVRTIIKSLLRRLRKENVTLRLGLGVRHLNTEGGRVSAVELDNGTLCQPSAIFSCAGYAETLALAGIEPPKERRLSFVEGIFITPQSPATWGWKDTITFFSKKDTFAYRIPQGLIDLDSGVICIPNNYNTGNRALPEGITRITVLANYDAWKALSPSAYADNKALCLEQLKQLIQRQLGPGRFSPIAEDLFTPLSIERFTGHLGGSVYGSPNKHRDGQTPFDNLFVCGTDQGFLGITGALLSGTVSAAKSLVRLS